VKRLAAAALVLCAALTGCMGDDGSNAPVVQACEVEIQDPGRVPDLAPLGRGRSYQIAFTTTHGNFTVEIDEETAPCNGDSLLDLARAGFFDGTRFHRIVPGFVIQGGDPTATGNGGPGYTTLDAPKPDSRYVKGVVAMAKSGFEPPGTGGSQFFIVIGDDLMLPPDYAIVGRVVEGMAAVDKIGKLGNRASERPTERIVIRKTAVSVSDG
jgi:peptidyl-prolyl cis-trans isomerase B (cyclophilin B)